MADHSQPIPSPVPSEAVPFTAAIPDHQLIRLIGRGSYGEVWLARSTLGTYRAVKIVYEKTFRHHRPFEREFNGVQKFEPISRSHEGLVDILQVGRNDQSGYFYCVMELADDVVSGRTIDPDNYCPRTLAHDMAKHKRLPLADCRRIGTSVATALGFLHGHGLIHRDIKPSNIVFVEGIPKLADIGLVAEMSDAKSYVGTEGFIPPEGPGTVRADLYSLGKVLYEISTGKDRHDYPELPTYLGDTLQKRELIELNKIILTACRADPAQRYESAAEMAADLGQLRHRKRSLQRTARRLLPRAAIAAGAVAAAVVLGWWAVRPKPAPAPAGLVAWWRAEGNTRDAIGGGDGRRIGHAKYGAGKVGQAFVFDGESDEVRLEHGTNLHLQNFTIEAWIKRDDAAVVTRQPFSGGRIIGFGEGGYCLSVRNDGVVSLSKAGTERVETPPRITDTEFHHIAVTKSEDLVTFFIDGVAYPTKRLGARFIFDTPLGIGGLTDDSNAGTFLGRIDEVSIYNQALMGDEIQTLYRADTAGKTPPPASVPAPSGQVSWWRAEGDARDEAGRHHGALYGIAFSQGKVGRSFDIVPFAVPSLYRVRVPDHDDFKLTDSLTIEGWVLIRIGGGVIFHRGDDRLGLDPYSLETVDWQIVFQIQSLTDTMRLSAPIARSEWKHVAATLDGKTGSMKMYLDGTLAATTNTSIRPFADLDPQFNPAIGIGNVADLKKALSFDGQIDELAVYSRALSEKEIKALFKAGYSGKQPIEVSQSGVTVERPASPAPRPQAPVPPGLIGWWRGEGEARDATGNSHGEFIGKASFVSGMVGQAFSFNGAGDYVKVPWTRVLDPSDALTIEFWMKPDLENSMNNCCQGLVTTDYYGIEVAPGWTFGVGVNFGLGINRAELSAAIAHTNGGGAVISSGEWHHVAGTYDGAKLQLYIDGRPWGKSYLHNEKIPPMQPGSFLAIGSTDGRAVDPQFLGKRYFKGLMDEVSIYNRALAPEEVAAIYDAGSAGKSLTSHTP